MSNFVGIAPVSASALAILHSLNAGVISAPVSGCSSNFEANASLDSAFLTLQTNNRASVVERPKALSKEYVKQVLVADKKTERDEQGACQPGTQQELPAKDDKTINKPASPGTQSWPKTQG